MIAAPKAANMVPSSPRPERTEIRITPSPGDSHTWSIGAPVVPRATPWPPSVVAAHPVDHTKTRVLDGFGPKSRNRQERDQRRDLRKDLRFDVEVTQFRGLHPRREEFGFAIDWRPPAAIQRDYVRSWQAFAPAFQPQPSFPVPEIPLRLQLSQQGGPHAWEMDPFVTPARTHDNLAGHMTGGGKLQILGFDLEASPVLPSRLSSALYRSGDISPRPPIREGPGLRNYKHSPQASSSFSFLEGRVIPELRKPPHQALRVQPDLTPSAMPRRVAQAPRIGQHREQDQAPLNLGSNDDFWQLESRTAGPPMVDAPGSKKSVPYLQVSAGPLPVEPILPSELREGTHQLPSILPDLMSPPTPVREAQRPWMRRETSAAPAPSTLVPNENFWQLQSDTALPPMVDATPGKKGVPYVQVLASSVEAALSFEPPASVGRHPRIEPDLIPTATPLQAVREAATAGDALPAFYARVGLSMDWDGRYSQIQKRMAQPPMVARSTALAFFQQPALERGGVPDTTKHEGLGIEAQGRFSRMQDRTAQIPGFAESGTFGFLRLPVRLAEDAGTLPDLDLYARIHIPTGGSFSQFQNRTAQPPMFTPSRTYDYTRRPIVLASIPSLTPRLSAYGAADLTIRQRPEMRGSSSTPKAMDPREPLTLAMRLDVTLDPKVAPFAHARYQGLVSLATGPGGPRSSERLSNQPWGSLSRLVRGSAGTVPTNLAVPIRPDFASLPKPYDSETPASAEALRERIFKPIVKSHFAIGELKLKARLPALRPTSDTAVLDFRLQRRRAVWDRSGRWKRLKSGPKGAPIPSTTRDSPLV